jgi:uncharacterized glyoxalase superfamily protein PhnB
MKYTILIYESPAEFSARADVTQSLYVYVDDVDRHFARARQAGAAIIEEPSDQSYGDRRYGAADPEGHHWYFAQRIRDAPAGDVKLPA